MRIVWDGPEARPYSSGVDQGVLYPGDNPGVPWNGLISVSETGEPNQEARYFDGIRYLTRGLPSGFSGVISAYTYPDELEPYIGISGGFTGQNRRSFGLTYRTSNEIHIVYNVLAAPSNQDYSTIGAEAAPSSMVWNFTTVPVKIPGGKPSAHIVILIDESNPVALSSLEALLYGDDTNEPSLPSVDDILALFEASAILQITDNGDGTWSATGPDDVVIDNGNGTFTINYSTVVIVGDGTFRVDSL